MVCLCEVMMREKKKMLTYNWCDAGLCVASFTQLVDRLWRTKTDREKKNIRIWFINFIIKLLFTLQTKNKLAALQDTETGAYTLYLIRLLFCRLKYFDCCLYRNLIESSFLLLLLCLVAPNIKCTSTVIPAESDWLKCVLHRLFSILFTNLTRKRCWIKDRHCLCCVFFNKQNSKLMESHSYSKKLPHPFWIWVLRFKWNVNCGLWDETFGILGLKLWISVEFERME